MRSASELKLSGRPRSRRDFLRTAASGAAVASLAPVIGACGKVGASTSSGKRNVIRFAFAPDPVWDYMNDNSMIVNWEEKYNQRIVTSSTWDEFAYFAGGHGDIVSLATYELPLLEKKTGIKTVTFGKYNLLRITPLAKPEKNYKTLADIPKGSKIAVPSAVSSTLVWGMFAKKLHNLDFRVGGGDFDLVVEDHFVMAEHVMRDQVEAALVIPEAAISQLRKGELEVMYDGKLPWQIYSGIVGHEHKGVMGNNFTATKKWYDANPEAASAFLALWESGIKAWRQNQAKIIKTYPQDFAVESDADVKAMQDYLSKHDWFVPSVYLQDDWIGQEKQLYPLMKQTGFMDKNAPDPEWKVTKPPANA